MNKRRKKRKAMKAWRKAGRPMRCFICGEVIGSAGGAGLVIDATFHNAIHHPAAFGKIGKIDPQYWFADDGWRKPMNWRARRRLIRAYAKGAPQRQRDGRLIRT